MRSLRSAEMIRGVTFHRSRPCSSEYLLLARRQRRAVEGSAWTGRRWSASRPSGSSVPRSRQVRRPAALIFMAAILLHMLRVFFTGAFRRPRETNWVIGILLFTLGMAEGFAGCSLP